MTKKNQQRMVKAWTANDITFHSITMQVAVDNNRNTSTLTDLARQINFPPWMKLIDCFDTDLELYFKPVGDIEAFYQTKEKEIHDA